MTAWIWRPSVRLERPAGAREAAEIGQVFVFGDPKTFRRGYSPTRFMGSIGTTEVVPCYKAFEICRRGEFFRRG